MAELIYNEMALETLYALHDFENLEFTVADGKVTGVEVE